MEESGAIDRLSEQVNKLLEHCDALDSDLKVSRQKVAEQNETIRSLQHKITELKGELKRESLGQNLGGSVYISTLMREVEECIKLVEGHL